MGARRTKGISRATTVSAKLSVYTEEILINTDSRKSPTKIYGSAAIRHRSTSRSNTENET